VILNAHNTVENGQEWTGTVNGQEHLGTFELERSNASERIVENDHGTPEFHNTAFSTCTNSVPVRHPPLR
jgi:hypothetical protein